MQELWPKIFQQVGFGSPFENQRQTSKMFPMLFKSCTNIGLTKHKKTAHDNDCEPLDTPSTPNPQNAIENLQKILLRIPMIIISYLLLSKVKNIIIAAQIERMHKQCIFSSKGI